MNDIQIAEAITPQIGLHYKEGRSNCRILPKYALTCFRTLASVLCDLIAGEDGPKGTLEGRIDQMFAEKLLDKSTAYRLHELRNNGNKGTHPEQYPNANFDELASSSETAAIKLIEWLYKSRGGKLPEDIEIADVASTELHRLGYLAMFGRDVDAMYRAGLYLQQRAENDSKVGSGVIRPDGYMVTSEQDIEQAMLWFKCAAKEGHVDAMYQYGLYRSQSKVVPEDPIYARQDGERYLFLASEQGNADALCASGDLYRHGSALHDKDLSMAIEYYEKAAVQKHPVAMATLGYMYSQGEGCEPNAEAAAQMSLRAAEAGYPQGQYNVCQHYLKGDGIELDAKKGYAWLDAAADQGYQPAQLLIAQLMIQGEEWPKYDAHDLFQSAAQEPYLRSRVLFSLSKLEREQSKGLESWLNTASYLQKCYALVVDEKDCHGIKDEVIASSKTVVGRLRTHVQMVGPQQDGSDLLACCLFHASGVPLTEPEKLQFYSELSDIAVQAAADRVAGIDKGMDKSQQFLLRRACIK
tara:strand:+ start:299 stop:1870 length:1572 start_codon:yes stop_codon:yes gene_type:complete